MTSPDRSLTVEHAHPRLRVDPGPLEACLRTVLDREGCRRFDVTVILTTHATVRPLNRQFLDHDYDTDVLAFDLRDAPDAPDLEGEVYIDLDTAFERHGEFNVPFDLEVRRYAVHGVLHLLGYDDATPDGKAHMHRLEDRYLAHTDLEK